ncbi:MAG: HDOD domain-containing protein [Acidobacteriota bacterium]
MPTEEVFLARQPIFDRSKAVHAYELLFRSGRENRADFTDGNKATSQVIDTGFFTMDLERVTSGKPAFINFPRELLLQEMTTLIPPKMAVIEVLEEVQPDPEVLAALSKLKEQGYILALDDFVCADGYESLVPLADIIKIDFMLTQPESRLKLLDQLRGLAGPQMALLAEKVETYADFEEAFELGFRFFQGYFFAKPSILSARRIPAHKMTYVRILQEIHNPSLDFGRLEQVIKSDLSLTTKLLQYINAAAFPWRRRIESVKQALVLLGEKPLRKWVSVVVLTEMMSDKPRELAVTACVRGHFCEGIGAAMRSHPAELDCFLVGSFSTLPAMLDVDLEDGLRQLPLSPEVADALRGTDNEFGQMLGLALAYERGDWSTTADLSAALGVQPEPLPELYVESIEWADRIFSTGA